MARYLVTGVTSDVARPVAEALAKEHEVIGAARFRDAAAREPLHAAGVKTARLDLVKGDLSDLPDDVDYVLHFAVVKSQKWGVDLDGNVGGLALLMERYAGARGFLHCSTTAVYQPDGHTAFSEESPLGDSHRNYFLPTYSICKIAAEAAARHGARRWGLPTLRVVKWRAGGRRAPRRPPVGAADDDRSAQRAIRRRLGLADVSPRADGERPGGGGAPRCAERVPPDPLRRHRRDGAQA